MYAVLEGEVEIAKHGHLLVQQTPFFALQIMHILAERLRRNTNA